MAIKREPLLKLGLQSTGMAKQWEETWLQVCAAGSACVGSRDSLNPSSWLVSAMGAAAPAVRPLPLHSAPPAGDDMGSLQNKQQFVSG